MTFDEAMRFWFSRVNYEQRSPRPSDLKLDRMRALLERLGNPQENLRIVHVAGSKGKGSTSAMLAAVLRQAGYRTGLFTSPHLVATEERIQVDGAPISQGELAMLMSAIQPCVEAVDRKRPADAIGVTFFEIATALGFLHFKRRRAEVVVLEVGLGGRFDSTNVCDPALAIITSISLDHTQQLGETLAAIAGEKAGIVKPGRPTLSGAQDAESRQVIRDICRQRRSALNELDIHIRYQPTPGIITAETTRLPRVSIATRERKWPAMELSLFGEHQAANAALVVAAVEELRRQGMYVSDAAVAEGLRSVRWPARLEVMCRRPMVVLDCAHNTASIQALLDTLEQSFPQPSLHASEHDVALRRGRRMLIFATSSDKDVRGIVDLLAPHFSQVFLTRYAHSSRSAAPEQLLKFWQRTSSNPATICETAAEAFQAAPASARPEDMICVTGSVFLAGELRAALCQDAHSPV